MSLKLVDENSSAFNLDSLHGQETSIETVNERSFVCAYDDCYKSYSSSSHLKRHEDTHEGNFRCTDEKCGMNFKTKFTLKKHVDNIHLKKKPKKYKCQDCGEEFNKHNWLTSHQYKHTGLKPYECSVEGCNARFLLPSRLKRHMKIHNGYTCTKENCTEHFSKWTSYTKHLKISHPRVFKCNYCERTFSRSNNLKAHSEVHNIDREVFLCPKPDCSRFYFMKRNLTFHIKSYHDKRPFVCSNTHCFKAFKSEADLKAHLSCHDPSKRIRKKKKKPKPSFAAILAGCVPKKWQIDLDKCETNVSEKETCQESISKCQETQHKPELNKNEQVSQLTISTGYKDMSELTFIEEESHDIQGDIENDSSCSDEIKRLLNMIKKRQHCDNGSITQNADCISAKA